MWFFKPSKLRIKLYAITTWIVVRLGLAHVDESHTKRPESRRTDIVRVETPNKKSVKQFIKFKNK